MSPVSPYDEAMEALSSLITKRSRTHKSSKGDSFDLLFDYIEILELEEPIKQMKIIHVAGTKGKGSTCSFTESILRNCGFHTGLFSFPHLIDVRERFRLDGVDICEEKFMAYFWWCWDRLKERTSIEVPMPTYFHFLALLAFKIFSAEQVDVAILEVGLGGKFDATNVVENPVVCGISSLGYDHMEILGNTLGQIAGQKAGIFKPGVLAFTVPQPEEAMHVLEQKALQLEILLFNCMSIRDPQLLLPRLMRACATHGVHLKEALFVPNVSLYYKVGANASPQADYQVDLSWQLTLQRIWENFIHGEKGRNAKNADLTYEEGADILERGAGICMNSKVFPSLPLATNWLRDGVRKNRSVRFQNYWVFQRG